MFQPLPTSFYTRNDVVLISRELLGKSLVTQINGVRTSGMIVETEAYAGPTDRACHAYNWRHTRRTAPMYLEGGIAYIYLIYGIHHLFNIVTNIADQPYAILVRAVEPQEGIEEMLLRRKMQRPELRLTAGPGAMSTALGITTALTGESLQGPNIWLEDQGIHLAKKEIEVGTRVGVAYAGADALLPYRFSIRGNAWVSRGKGL